MLEKSAIILITFIKKEKSLNFKQWILQYTVYLGLKEKKRNFNCDDRHYNNHVPNVGYTLIRG